MLNKSAQLFNYDITIHFDLAQTPLLVPLAAVRLCGASAPVLLPAEEDNVGTELPLSSMAFLLVDEGLGRATALVIVSKG